MVRGLSKDMRPSLRATLKEEGDMDENKVAPRNLVAIAAHIADIERQILEAGGELTPEIEAAFDLSQGEFSEKIDRYYWMIQACDWRAAQFKSIADQGTAARKNFENVKERLKDRLKLVAKEGDVDELKGVDWRFKISVSSKPKLVFTGEPIPQEWCKEEIKFVPDKERIENALLMGEKVPGVHFEDVQSIRSYPNKGPKLMKESKDGK